MKRASNDYFRKEQNNKLEKVSNDYFRKEWNNKTEKGFLTKNKKTWKLFRKKRQKISLIFSTLFIIHFYLFIDFIFWFFSILLFRKKRLRNGPDPHTGNATAPSGLRNEILDIRNGMELIYHITHTVYNLYYTVYYMHYITIHPKVLVAGWTPDVARFSQRASFPGRPAGGKCGPGDPCRLLGGSSRRQLGSSRRPLRPSRRQILADPHQTTAHPSRNGWKSAEIYWNHCQLREREARETLACYFGAPAGASRRQLGPSRRQRGKTGGQNFGEIS